jgi:hypothetical protein
VVLVPASPSPGDRSTDLRRSIPDRSQYMPRAPLLLCRLRDFDTKTMAWRWPSASQTLRVLLVGPGPAGGPCPVGQTPRARVQRCGRHAGSCVAVTQTRPSPEARQCTGRDARWCPMAQSGRGKCQAALGQEAVTLVEGECPARHILAGGDPTPAGRSGRLQRWLSWGSIRFLRGEADLVGADLAVSGVAPARGGCLLARLTFDRGNRP